MQIYTHKATGLYYRQYGMYNAFMVCTEDGVPYKSRQGRRVISGMTLGLTKHKVL